ncbi:FAD-dependent oxidoreductase [Pararhodobacter oceanensis]|uniref:Oxidoreductase n=1 Tax=Pararhodobacter oceanensis TaxID=2172121 RepID=A0A2T8HXE0_9RHOB|nr:FAD-dependent oxidoreductase [Pararhodobacter oceanensis]PVH30097.1 oxidoreductase [Pararhodobacter oceanensis]
MSASHSRLLASLDLRGQTLRNRIVFGAHTANMAEDGLPGARYTGYLRERALGGAGMIVAEPVPVHRTGVLTRGNFRHQDDSIIPAFRQLTEAVRAEGAVILQQLYHIGAHGDSDLSFTPHWSPSGRPSYHDTDGSHAMSEGEILELLEAHIAAAKRAYLAGFQGVELWAAYNSLVDQFWLPWTNRREDRWGGSLENRTRFSRLLIEGVRRECGEDFIIGMAISHDANYPITLQGEALCEIIALHDATGDLDYVTCGAGSYLDFGRIIPPFTEPDTLTVPITAQLKAVVRNAKVTAEAGIRTPDVGEQVLASGAADLVSIVRGQIADPHLARKTTEGTAERVRPCLSCNQMCWGRRSRDYWISCLINPSAGREFEWGGDRFTPADSPAKVLVVGAGPAGLEAARAAAERGHSVILAEAQPQIGGQFRLAGQQPRRAQILDLLDWYERELSRLGVDLRLNSFLDDEAVREIGADHVILASGSLPDEDGFQRWLPDLAQLPGIERGAVWPAEAAMRREAQLGDTVIVYDEGGHWKGVGTAWHLAEAGHNVVLVTPDAYVGKELTRTAADGYARARLAKLGVRFVCESAISEWLGNGGGARVVSLLDRSEQVIPASALILATTNTAFDMLSEPLADLMPALIGDAAAPRLAPYAFYEGREIGRRL